jgi:DNA-binding NarL/FixJ family response regulator
MTTAIIADDHPLFRDAVRIHLTEFAGFQITGEATDGNEALKLCEELKPDLAIVDISMPYRDGLAVTREVSSWARAPKVIIVTAHSNLFCALRCYRAGALGFVAKTDPPSQLLAAAKHVLSGRRFVPSDLVHDVASHFLEHAGEGDPMDSLTARELEVLRMLAGGSTNREIAGELGVSVRTIDTHRSNLLKKLGLRNNADLARVAVHFGIVPL